MICLICRQAELVHGVTSVTLERAEIKLTAKNVPAFICPSCGDVCVSNDVAMWLLKHAERAVETGTYSDLEFLKTMQNDS
jgi:YgiT-type zinc finger domain-containing protein